MTPALPPEPQAPSSGASGNLAVPAVPTVPAWRFPLAYPAPLRRRSLLAVVSGVGLALFLVIAVLVGSGWESSFRLDVRLAVRANDAVINHPKYEELVHALTAVGDIVVVVAVAGVVFLGLLWTRRWWSALFLLVAVGGGSLSTLVLKEWVERPRPPSEYGLLADSPSFPSGHTSGTALLCLSLLVLILPWEPRNRWRLLTAIAVVVPLVIAATRVLLAVHFLSDVVAALLLATTVVPATLLLVRPWRDVDELRRRGGLDDSGDP